MRTILLLVVAACGGSDAHRQASVHGPASLEPAQAAKPSKPPVPPPTQVADVFALLHDVDGVIPGLDVVSTKRQADPTRCGGIRIDTTRDTIKKTANEDQDLLAVFDQAFPVGLDFTDGPKREAALERFNQWVSEIQRVAGAARSHYAGQTKTADETGRVIAVARLVQIQLRVASLFVRAEIPVDLRTGEFAADKTTAYCAQMAETAEAMLAGADQAATACAEHAKNIPPGWWTAVCKP